MPLFHKTTLIFASTLLLTGIPAFSMDSTTMPSAAVDASATPKGWEPGKEGPIFLRVQLSETAAAPIYLTGNAGWRYPRRFFSFTLGDHALPVFQADQVDGAVRKQMDHQWNIKLKQPELKPDETQHYIQPGGYSQWVELPSAALGGDWSNQIAIGFPKKIAIQDNDLVTNPDSEVVLEIASQPDSDAVIHRSPFKIGPNHPVASFLLNRQLNQPVVQDAVTLAQKTQDQVRKLLDENPVYGRRPEKFPITMGFASPRNSLPSLWQGVLPREAWEIELQTLEMLGVNGLKWQMGPELKARGFVNNAIQAYYWPSFPSEENVEKFVQDVAQKITDADAWDDVVTMSTFEENGGPPMKSLIEGDEMASAAAYREQFVSYLKSKGIHLEDLGKKDWAEVRIVGPTDAEREPELFYHSALFRPWIIANTVNRVDHYASKYFNKPLMRGVFTSDAYFATGSMLRQGIDLFRWIREAPGVADLSSEGWKNLSPTYEVTAWEMAVARSASRYKETPRPGLLNILNRTPTDIELSVWVALSQGANHLYHFGWGPWYAQSDGASDKPEITPALRKISYSIGALEELLVSDHVRPAETAILYSFPTDAWSWVKYDRSPFWLYENAGVFLSLAHQQIPSDLLIDEDVLKGELSKYKVLYIIGPNIEADVAERIAKWVKEGGVLVGTAGAGTRDQYNRPLSTLDNVFGTIQVAAEIKPKFDISTNLSQYPYATQRINTPDGGIAPLGGLLTPLKPEEATVIATLRNGEPAMTEHAYGEGRAYLIGASVGFTYLQDAAKRKAQKASTAMYQESHNPTEYSEEIRSIINLPAVKAGASRPVAINAPGVHAGLREGPKGAVVVLVNYPRKDWENLEIRVEGIDAKNVKRVTSTNLGKELDFKPVDEHCIQIHLPRLSLTEMIGIHFE